MERSVRASHDAAVRRARLLRRIAPVAALSAAALPYMVHHGTPLDGHGVSILFVIAAAAAIVVVVQAAFARAVEQQLPSVLSLRPESVAVRPIGNPDLDFCAALHAETLPHGFFAQLGHRFLKAYIATFVASPYAVALLATAGDTRVGMVVGMIRPGAHTRWVMRHHGPRLALRGLLGLASRPRLAVLFARTRVLRYRRAWSRRRPTNTAEVAAQQPAVLGHVAVLPGAQGSGFGSTLVDAFVSAAREAGCREVVLTTLDGPEGAGGFYRRRGWAERGTSLDFDGNSVLAFALPLTGVER